LKNRFFPYKETKMKWTQIGYRILISTLTLIFVSCSFETDAIPVLTASDFNITLGVGKTTESVNWRKSSFAVASDNGTIQATVKTQGTNGSFVIDGDTATYIRTVEGSTADSGVLTLTRGSVTHDINVNVTSLYEATSSITASNFSITLDTGESIRSIDWQHESNATSSGGGVMNITVKQQGSHGVFTVNSNTLIYMRQTEGNFTDQGILTISEGNSSVDITVNVDTLYWKYVSSGHYYTMAIKSDGTLWGWGANNYGQLGDGTTVERDNPVQIGTDSNWEKVYAKFIHTFAIKSDGTLWGWGYNRYGELGNGSVSDKHVPTQEPSKSTTWSDIAIGYYHTVALKSDGTLWACGRNNFGQLGDGTSTDRHTFVSIMPAVSDWSGVAAGYYHSIAVRQNGTLWGWGRNNYGQIGDSTTTNKNVPTQEALGDTDWETVASGYNHSLALKNDGSLWGWGYNNYAMIGDGTRTSRSTPTQEASSATDWVALDGGNYHSLALKSDGTLWGWGYNNYGQLTIGINLWRYGPEGLEADTQNAMVSASQYQSSVITNDGRLITWGATNGAQSANAE
jgi:alpha-tubulin suppressor-like RCC1 family protein